MEGKEPILSTALPVAPKEGVGVGKARAGMVPGTSLFEPYLGKCFRMSEFPSLSIEKGNRGDHFGPSSLQVALRGQPSRLGEGR